MKIVGFTGKVIFDSSKPDEAPRKLIDVPKLHSLGWHYKIEIKEGVQGLFDCYQESLME